MPYYRALARAVHEIVTAKHQEEAERVPITDCIAPCYLPVHDDIEAGRHTFYHFPGGRGSAKSSFCALEVVHGIMEDPDANGIVFRRYSVTMRESTFSQISWAIESLGAAPLWKGSISPMQFTYIPTGQQIQFRGVDDAAKIKSIRPRHGYFKFCWFEEFSEFDGPNMIRSVLQSVMRGGSDFRILASFNPPISKAAWSNKYIQLPNEQALVFHSDYTMIPPEWLGEGFIAEAQRLEQVNQEAYRHEYLGESTVTAGMVFPNVKAQTITEKDIEQMQYFYAGIDWGFSSDPFVFIRASYDSRKQTVYILDEIVRRGCSNADAVKLIMDKGFDKSPNQEDRYVSPLGYTVSGSERQMIICDSAEPKSIADVSGRGLKAIPCQKYPGSVNYGIRWLQSKTIVIDPKRTPAGYQEFTEYEYLRTKDGEILADVPDKNNHCIDALRYALDRLINNKAYSA